MTFRFFMYNPGRYIFKTVSLFSRTKLYPFLLPDHYAAHEDGDIEKTLSEINIEIAERDSVSPHPSKKARNNKTYRVKHLPYYW